ncbi:MAG: hypothetical protein VX913_13855 [Planctomycetota bacterium]|nr:hypothetical protein [Planctomycetota bacterium]
MTSRDLLAVIAIAAIVGAIVLPVLLADDVYLPRHPDTLDVPWKQAADRAPDAADRSVNFATSDKFNLIYPDQIYARQEAEDHGRLPEWNPHILGGVPHAANPLTSVFYPPGWLVLLVDREDGPLLAAGLHVFLAALFVFMLLRITGLGSVAASVGGACFALSGWVAAHLQNTQIVATVAWWPLGLFAIEARLRGHARWSLMTLAIALAMMWLAGWPQLALLGTLVIAIWAVVGICARLREDDRARVGRHAGGIFIFALVGLLLASVQLLPTGELMQYAGHKDVSVDSLVDQRFRPIGWTGLVLPGFMGDASDGQWQDHWGAIIGMGEGTAAPARPPAVMNWGERTIYPGILTLALAVVGLLYARDRVRWGLVSIAAVGAAMATSSTVIAGLSHVPFFDVGAPARAVVLPAFAIACLAGCGFQVLLDGHIPRMLRSVRFVTIATAIPMALLTAGVLWSLIWSDDMLWMLVELLKTLDIAQRLAPGDLPDTAQCVEQLRPAFGDLKADLIRLLAVGGAGWLLLMARIRRPAWAPRLALAAAVVILLDLLTFFIPPNLPVTSDGLFRATPGISWLQERLEADRFMRVSATAADAANEYHTLFVPNTALLYGLHDAQGWREQVPLWYPDLWRGTSAIVRNEGISGIAADQADSKVLDLARVRYLVSAHRIPALSEKLVYPLDHAGRATSDLWIYENEDRQPRAWVVHSARCLPDSEARDLLRSGQCALDAEVILHAWPDGVSSQHPTAEGMDTVQFQRQDPGRLAMTATTRGAGWLVVNDTWFPGWRAWITDESGSRTEVPVARAWTAFMAIPIGVGEQKIELEYRPRSITVGVVLTGLGWIGVLLLPLLRAATSAQRTTRSLPDTSGPEA